MDFVLFISLALFHFFYLSLSLPLSCVVIVGWICWMDGWMHEFHRVQYEKKYTYKKIENNNNKKKMAATQAPNGPAAGAVCFLFCWSLAVKGQGD